LDPESGHAPSHHGGLFLTIVCPAEGRYPLPVGPMQRSTIWYRDMLPESPTGTGTDTQAPTSRGPGNVTVGDRPDILRVTEVTPSLAERSGARWVLRPMVIYLASRVVTVVALAVATTSSHTSILGEINTWDSRWFIRAAQFGWPTHPPQSHGHVVGNTIAFFPLFPLTIRWLSHLTGLSLLTAGIVISATTGLSAMIGIWALVRHYADQRSADRATLLVAMFPGTFVLSLVYSEGIVVTCVAFGLLALLQRRWLLAGILGMLATATTPIALAFEVSCLWCAYCELVKNRNWRVIAAPILAPLGFVAYQLWLWVHTDNLLAWRVTERSGWSSYPSIAYPAHLVATFLRDPVATNQQQDLLFVGIVVTVIAAVFALRSRMPMPMLLYGLAAASLALVAAPVGLRPRFIFLAFPLIIAVATSLRRWAYAAVLSVSIVLLGVLMGYSVTSYAIFP
jgi:hypothetical protein